MKKEEFFNIIGEVDEQKVAVAGMAINTKKKSHPIWVKWGAMAVCLCLVAVGTFVMPGVWNSPNTTIPDSSISGTPAISNGTNQQVEVQNEPAIEPPLGDTDNGVMIGGPFNNQDFLPGKPMISNYGEMTSEIDMAVNNGHLHTSKALEAAMENYGEDANYRVLIMLFRDGVHISSGEALALEEAKRLSELGYIVAMETYTEEIDHGEYVSANATYYFTLHATYNQLKNFSASDSFGYSIMLYDEYLGGTISSDTVVFNGAAQITN